MPEFRFEAVDSEGKARSGIVDTSNARLARDQLRREGLFPTAIDELASRRETQAFFTTLPAAVVSLLTRQLSTLIGSGMPLEQALVAVAAQSENRTVVKVVDDLREQVAAGDSLSGALARFPRIFPELYRGLVAVGAETGQLGPVLTRLADYLESRQALRQKMVAAIIYPALVTVIASAVIGVLLLYVVPQIVSVYQQSRQTLPWLTRALIAVSGFLRVTLWYWVALGFASSLVVAWLLKRPRYRELVHRILLRTPLVGRLVRGIDTARFASTLSILTGSGAPLLRALDTAAAVVWSLPLREATAEAASLVREGVSLSRALGSRGVFPPLLIHLVANGEASGQLPEMLERAAREQESEIERLFTWLAALLQPVLIVFMGAIVLVLVLAVMLPIVSMNQLIR